MRNVLQVQRFSESISLGLMDIDEANRLRNGENGLSASKQEGKADAKSSGFSFSKAAGKEQKLPAATPVPKAAAQPTTTTTNLPLGELHHRYAWLRDDKSLWHTSGQLN